jgi:nitrogen fixation protein FixH
MNNPVKKSKIPYFFVIFFVVFLSVDILYIFISNKTWRGVVSNDSYEKGINHNQVLNLIDKQKKLGWKVDIKFENLGKNKGLLQVKVTDKEKNNLNSAKIEVILKRPTQEGLDFRVKLPDNKNGWFQKVIDFPAKGQWQFEIIIENYTEILQEVRKYVIQ